MSAASELLDDVVYYARAGDLDEIKQLKTEPRLFITKDDTGKTALHMASANNHLDIVTYIIGELNKLGNEEKKKLINTPNNEGNTPLHWAALNGHLKVVELLVGNGADCKIKNSMNHTPIYDAQQRNHEAIAEFFLKTMIDEAPEEPMNEEDQFKETGVPEKS
ncbi:ankyrin repeat-containing domain protein [Pilobolus umbonatus]|nr:ankyrin repeat-containing domain protein [Pilobolus umbonatus]